MKNAQPGTPDMTNARRPEIKRSSSSQSRNADRPRSAASRPATERRPVAPELRGSRAGAAAAVAILCTIAGAITGGTTVVRMTLSEVIAESALIAVGRVETVDNVQGPRADIPFTEVVLSDLDMVAGDGETGRLRLLFAGGTTPDGLTLEIAGMPQFSPGQRVVIFADPGDGVLCPLVGWWQGLYRLAYDPARGTDVVYNHAGVPVTGISGDPGRLTALTAGSADQQPELEPMTLDAFLDRVRTAP